MPVARRSGSWSIESMRGLGCPREIPRVEKGCSFEPLRYNSTARVFRATSMRTGRRRARIGPCVRQTHAQVVAVLGGEVMCQVRALLGAALRLCKATFGRMCECRMELGPRPKAAICPACVLRRGHD